MAVQDYELLLRVRADLLEALNGLKGLNTALGDAGAAAGQLGESEAQATDRIKAMVQASRDQQQALQGAASATRDAADQSARTVAAYDQQAAAAQRAAAANVNYNRSFSQAGGNATSTASATAQLAAQRAEMAKLAQQIDPTVNALAKLDAQERSLNAMRKAGVVGIEDYQRFKAVIDANRLSITGAGKAMHSFSLNTAQTRLEMGRLIKDIGTGQWGRLASTGTTLANQAGFISALFSPVGLAIAAVTGSIAAFGLAANAAANDANAFNTALAKTGNFAGQTAASMEAMAGQIAGGNERLGEARTVLTALAASGKVGQGALYNMGQAALDMAQLTGESADKAAAAVVSMFDGTTASLIKANDQYHFLTTATYDQIAALIDQGDQQQAMDLAAQAFHDAAMQRIADETEQVRGLAKVWANVRDGFKSGWQEFKNGASLITGTADDQSKLYALLGRKAAATPIDAKGHLGFQGVFNNVLGLGWGPEQEAELKALQDKIAASTAKAEKDGFNQQLTDGAIKAGKSIDDLSKSLDKNYAKQEALKKLDADFLKLWNGNDPDHPNPRLAGVQAITGDDGKTTFAGGEYDTLRAALEKRYAEKTPHAKREKSDAAAVAAQQQLIKLLGDEQGALDPTVKVWADYNDKVAKANELAAKAKTARGADIAAINAQRDAVIANAGAVRDAALDKIIDKDREAWEKLRDSLRTPVEVKTDKAQAQLEKLNELMVKLKGGKDAISQADYSDALQRIAQQSITKAPQYKDPTKSTDAFGGLGAMAGVGGPAGGAVGSMGKAFEGLAKNFKAEDDLGTWYADQLAAIAKDRDKDLASHQLYLAQKAELDKQYAEQSKLIDNARYGLGLSAASNFFGGLATLQHSSNNKMARVGKAAAIAQATINTYQAATGAYSAMASIPYIGPVLGAVAAAAAIVAGLANVAQIRAQPSGYAEGGYTGPGGKHQPAGIVHAGEVVFSQRDVARHGGVAAVESLRLGGAPSFADGGYVPALPSLGAPLGLAAGVADAAAARRAGPDGAPSDAGQTHIHVWSMEEAAQKLAEVPSFQSAVVHIVGDNPRTIQGKWGR